MVRTIKSVLLFDYDGINRSLHRRNPGLGDAFGARAGLWLEAIESAEILPTADADTRRRFQTKRCYADPKVLGKNRGWLSANGVQIVDTGTPAGLGRGAADLHMTLDALDALDSEAEEFILLSAEADLTPLLLRLRTRQPRVVIYGTEATAPAYRQFANAVLEESELARVLSRQSDAPTRAPAAAAGTQGGTAIPRAPRMAPVGGPNPNPLRRVSPTPQAPAAAPVPVAAASVAATPASAAATPAAPTGALPPGQAPAKARAEIELPRGPIDRDALAALVRRVHQATSVPLFSPKGFGDLFRLLVAEVARNGYKFQATSENIAAELNKLGRNVTKRQVGFIIKGLALRGHVFSANDDPEALAHAFYDQVLYLADGAKLNLSGQEKALVAAWVIGIKREETAAAPAPAVAVAPAPAPPVAAPAAAPTRARPASPRAAAQREAVVTPPPPPPKEEAPPPKPSLAERVRRERPAAAEMKTGPAAERGARAAVAREAELEESILAAISDAVDVLVDDWSEKAPEAGEAAPAEVFEAEPPPVPEPEPAPAPRVRPSATSPRREPAAGPQRREPPAPPRREAPPVAPPQPAPAAAEVEGGDDIGDEIQRILASYSRGR